MEVECEEIREKEEIDVDNVDNQVTIVIPGEVITTEQGYLKGHGVYVQNGNMIASVCGVLEKVNKLITVTPLKSRYNPEIGDVVVGRVIELTQNSWSVDIGSSRNATLGLNSIILPGGALRKRTEEDKLQMRKFYIESDVLSAEVQSVKKNGSISLQARSVKYGKLENGVFVSVPPSLIKRLSQHFVNLECGVGCIIGTNGYIWVTERFQDDIREKGNHMLLETDEKKGNGYKLVQSDVRIRIARVVSSINYLKSKWIKIHPLSIMQTYQMLQQQEREKS